MPGVFWILVRNYLQSSDKGADQPGNGRSPKQVLSSTHLQSIQRCQPGSSAEQLGLLALLKVARRCNDESYAPRTLCPAGQEGE